MSLFRRCYARSTQLVSLVTEDEKYPQVNITNYMKNRVKVIKATT